MTEVQIDDIQLLRFDLLDALLVECRKDATKTWPYSGTNDKVRMIEAEYTRRGEQLPENR